MASGTKNMESPADWLMRRLRVEYGLEFIYADLSREAREKVMKYATLWRDWEKGMSERNEKDRP